MMSSIRGISICVRWLGGAPVSERNKRQWNARAERTGMCQPLATEDRGSRTSTGAHRAMCNLSPVVRRTDRGCLDRSWICSGVTSLPVAMGSGDTHLAMPRSWELATIARPNPVTDRERAAGVGPRSPIA